MRYTIKRLSAEQQNILSDFFKDIAVGWFAGLFIVPQLSPEFGTLTVLKYLANICFNLFAAMVLRRE